MIDDELVSSVDEQAVRVGQLWRLAAHVDEIRRSREAQAEPNWEPLEREFARLEKNWDAFERYFSRGIDRLRSTTEGLMAVIDRHTRMNGSLEYIETRLEATLNARGLQSERQKAAERAALADLEEIWANNNTEEGT